MIPARSGLARLLALSLAAALPACSWLPWGGGQKSTLPAITTNDLSVAWSVSVGKSGGNLFVPAPTYRGYYAAAADGSVYELADESGRIVSRFDTKSRLRAGVGTGENVVVVANEKGDVQVLDGGGRELWRYAVAGEVIAAPLVVQGTVVVRTADGRMIALNRLDGKRKWVLQRQTPALTLRSNATGLVHRGVLYAGYPGGKVLAVEVDTGKPVWEATLSPPRGATELERVADIAGIPVIDDTRVCAAVYQGRTGCVETLSGNVLWSREIGSPGGVAVDLKHLYVADSDGTVFALDKTSGSTVWKQDKLARREPGTPVVTKGRVLVGDNEGLIHALTLEKGEFSGRVATDGSRIISLQVSGDRAIAQTEKGGVFAIALR
ncbi:MAG TPA: outer membrane protein assembly factor BamB [Usitatibacteraceae bacterium]|nr:outer membrane protein assembly factor BamB [Usitatibacteraceae bacterium]